MHTKIWRTERNEVGVERTRAETLTPSTSLNALAGG